MAIFMYRIDKIVFMVIEAVLLPNFNYGKIQNPRFIPKGTVGVWANLEKSDSKTGYRNISSGTFYIKSDGTIYTDYPFNATLYSGTFIYRIDK